MHDEDNAIGLSASNANRDTWTMFGDKRLYDKVDEMNLGICRLAMQASADEIGDTWKTNAAPGYVNVQSTQTMARSGSSSQRG